MARSNVAEVRRLPVVRKLLLGLAVGLVAGFAVDAARSAGLFEVLEGESVNWRIRTSADPAGNDPEIVLVVIDQQSLEALARERGGVRYAWPWPRFVYNALLDATQTAGAKLVVFDLLFSESGSEGEPYDNAFAVGAGSAGRVVLGSEFLDEASGYVPEELPFARQFALPDGFAPPADRAGDAWRLPRHIAAFPPYRQLLQGLIVSESPEGYRDAAKGHLDFHTAPDDPTYRQLHERFRGLRFTGRPVPAIGVVNAIAEPDGTYRRYYLLHALDVAGRRRYLTAALSGREARVRDHALRVELGPDGTAPGYAVFPSLALAAVRELQRTPGAPPPPVTRDGDALLVGRYRIPVGDDGGFYVKFPAPTRDKRGAYPQIPFWHIYQAEQIAAARDRTTARYRFGLLMAAAERERFAEATAPALAALGELGAEVDRLDERLRGLYEQGGVPSPIEALRARLQADIKTLKSGTGGFPAGALGSELAALATALEEQITGPLPLDVSVKLTWAQAKLARQAPVGAGGVPAPPGAAPFTADDNVAVREALHRAWRALQIELGRRASAIVRDFDRTAGPRWRQFQVAEAAVVSAVERWLAGDGQALLADPPPAGATEEAVAFARAMASARQRFEREQARLPATFDIQKLAGKIVIVGGTAPGLKDVRRSPFSAGDAGVNLHAAAIDNIINGQQVARQSVGWRRTTVLALALLAALLMMVVPQAILGLLAVLGLAGAYSGLVLASFSGASPLWLAWVAPLVALTLAAGLAQGVAYLLVGRDRKKLKGAMSQYLGRDLVAVVDRHPERLRLGGEKRPVTVYFSDVANFTTISEGLEPAVLTELMNRYLGSMTNILLASGAMIDKYIGDAIMAVFSAPFDLEDHAIKACTGALAGQRELARLRETLNAAGFPALFARVGLNSGEAVVGNMGSSLRFSYTAMGNTVNLAARLEPACKDYGVSMLIGEATYALARDAVVARNVDRLQVKGKAEAVNVYELLGLRDELDEATQRLLSRFEEGMKRYYACQFEQAIASFEQALKVKPGDGPSAAAIARCRAFLVAPPPADWDGRRIRIEKH